MFRYILEGHEEHLDLYYAEGVYFAGCDFCGGDYRHIAQTEYGDIICHECATKYGTLEEVTM